MAVKLIYLFVISSNLSTGFRWGGKHLTEEHECLDALQAPRFPDQHATRLMSSQTNNTAIWNTVYELHVQDCPTPLYTLKMEAVGSSVIFVPIYEVTRRNVNTHCNPSLNSHNAPHRPRTQHVMAESVWIWARCSGIFNGNCTSNLYAKLLRFKF